MSLRTALAGAATTAIVVAALGNPAVVEAARDSSQQAIASTLSGFVNWDVADASGEVVGLVALRLGVLIVMSGLLCALVGRSRSRLAAFLGAWGAVGVAAAMAGSASYVYQVPVVLDGNSGAPTYFDGLVLAVNGGAAFGLWAGWVVAFVVALVTRTAAVVAPDGPYATAPAPGPSATAARISEPPPPWWAPTHAADAGVRPGPTAFPPGGLAGPVVAGGDEPITPYPASAPARAGTPQDMTTASGDPHPSDPDATRPVGLPPDPESDEDPRAAPPVTTDPATMDPDATTTMAPDPAGGDQTAQMPRRPEP